MLASSRHRAIEPPSRQSIEPASSHSIELSVSSIEAGAQAHERGAARPNC
jgi:hypothetical protein